MQEERILLVVDDEPSIRSLYHMTFQHLGHTVYDVGSGEDALEILAQQPVDVIFLDLSLPGVSGLELCHHIRESYPEAAVYAVTGDPSPFGGVGACLKAGFKKVLVKPIRIDDLKLALEG